MKTIEILSPDQYYVQFGSCVDAKIQHLRGIDEIVHVKGQVLLLLLMDLVNSSNFEWTKKSPTYLYSNISLACVRFSRAFRSLSHWILKLLNLYGLYFGYFVGLFPFPRP